MSDEKLKPCPFCGQAVRLKEYRMEFTQGSYWCVFCDNKDGCCGSADYCADSAEEMIEKYNQRANAS